MDEATKRRLVIVLGLRFFARGIGDRTIQRILPFVGPDMTPTDLADVAATAGMTGKPMMLFREALSADGWAACETGAMRLLDQAAARDVQILLIDTPGFPVRLRAIHDAPTVLFARGVPADDARAVACVGTRGMSHFGSETTRRVTSLLAEGGWTIVSGLAKGIDTVAHEAALDAGARTVAILGNGLDWYPAANRSLAERIVASGGLLLSEQPFGADPSPANLVQRDRLQSGMSVATLIFESPVGGGAMRTAAFARAQGRLVVCPVPTSKYADEVSCSGIQQLLADGAYPLPGRDAYLVLLEILTERARSNDLPAGSVEQARLYS